MHGSAKPSQQTLPGSQGASPPQEGPVTTPTDASATKKGPGAGDTSREHQQTSLWARRPRRISTKSCPNAALALWMDKAENSGQKKRHTGIKLAPVSGLEEQAAPGRNWAGPLRRGARVQELQRQGRRAAAPPPSWPRPRLPAPPQGRSTPGAGPNQQGPGPREPCPALRRRGTAPHRCTLGLVVLKRANTGAWSHERDYSSQHAERGGPAPPRDEGGPRSGARLSPSLPRPREGACAIRGPKAGTAWCNSASPRDAGGATCHGRSWTSHRPAGAGAPLAAGAAWPCSPRADPPGSRLAPPLPSPRGRANRQGARAQAARVGAGLARGGASPLGGGARPREPQPELSDG